MIEFYYGTVFSCRTDERKKVRGGGGLVEVTGEAERKTKWEKCR